jgi:hypothetical protein
MEMVRLADPAEGADGAAQIHVVAGDQKAAAAFVEGVDGGAFLRVQAIADIDREEPELIEIAVSQTCQYGIGLTGGARRDRGP